MSYRKYLNDYRVEEYTDEKGRTRRRAVYVAGNYTLSTKLSKLDKRLILIIPILNWIALICALLPVTRASMLLYVTLPHIFTMIPLFFMTGAAFTLISVDEEMIREKAENIASRLPYSSLFSALLPAFSFVALIVSAIMSWKDMLPGDIIFGALSLFNAASASFVFYKCRSIKANRV